MFFYSDTSVFAMAAMVTVQQAHDTPGGTFDLPKE